MDIDKYKGKLSLVQPNKVTNARYKYTEREENVMTLVIEAIQKHMTNEKSMQTDLFNQPMVRIDMKELGATNKTNYLKSLNSLRRKDISFDWVNDKSQKIRTETSLISAVHNHLESSFIDVTINTWAIPYLVYVGKGVGFTSFNKTIALTLQGEYTKRLYKLCKRWEDKGGFTMSLIEFRKMFSLESKYPRIKDFKTWVLDKSKDRMKEGADVYFDYSLRKIGGSRSYNQIDFVIHGNNKNLKKNEKTDMYVLVYNMLCLAYPNTKSSKAQNLCDSIANNPSEFERLYNRMKGLKGDLDVGDKDFNDVLKLIKHIIKEDYGDK